MPADPGGPGRGGADPGRQFVVLQGQSGDTAGPGVHGGGVQRGAGVPGGQDDGDGGEPEGDLTDQFQCGNRADEFVDEHHLGQLGGRLAGLLGQGVQQLPGVDGGRYRLGVGELAEQG